MARRHLVPCALLAALVLPSAASAAVVAPDLSVSSVAATGGAVAYLDDAGGIWATRVRTDGTTGSPLPVASGQRLVRDLQVVVTDRGETVVVWDTMTSSTSGLVRYAVAAKGIGFSGARTLASVGVSPSATPQAAALRGGTVAVLFRDVRAGTSHGVLRYARRAPGGTFGSARSLGVDGVQPQVEAAPGGGALLAWGRGAVGQRSLEVATAKKGATLPGAASSVAGDVSSLTLAAASDGTAWVTWTRRDATTSGFARRTRAANVSAVGPVQGLGNVAYGVPHVAYGPSAQPLVAWNAKGPGAQPNVTLASAQATGAALGSARPFDAGGFAQTSPLPAWAGTTSSVLFTRQVPGTPTGLRNEVVAADPATGALVVLGQSATIATPAVAGALVAWPQAGGGVSVSLRP